MNNSYNVFCKIMNDTRQTMVLFDYFDKVMNPPCDYSDLLRWQWVQSVSALDKLVHDLVKIGICQAYKNQRVQTKKFQAMSIDFNTLLNMEQNNSTADSVLESFLVLKFKTFSFQDPDKISDGLAHIWEEPHKWQKISNYMGKSENDTKNELKNIVLRRNQIAHEGDYLFHSGSRELIERTDTIEVMDFIQQLGTAIYNLVK